MPNPQDDELWSYRIPILRVYAPAFFSLYSVHVETGVCVCGVLMVSARIGYGTLLSLTYAVW